MSKRLSSGELENRVLEILWAHDHDMTAREVHDVLSDERQLAYTTPLTILVRLYDKGLLLRGRRGRAFTYRPVKGREESAADRMRQVLATAGDPAVALSRFVEALPERDRLQLREALEGPGRPG
jgi:predicted transcriptional regulator